MIKHIRGNKSHIRDAKRMKIEEGDLLILFAEQHRIVELDDRQTERLILDFDPTRRRMPDG